MEADDYFGSDIDNIGDLNGDGIDDLVVGAPFDDDVNTNAGAVYILFMKADGTVDDEQKISGLTGGADVVFDGGSSDYFGYAVASIGDVN